MPADGGEQAASRVERVLALRAFPGLAEVEPTHLGMLADVVRERTIAKGQTVLSPNTEVRAMYLIRSGELSVMRNGAVARRYRTGGIVGGIASLTRDPRGQHLVATADSRTFELDRDDFADVLEESFSLLQAVLRGLLQSALEVRLGIAKDAGFAGEVIEALRPSLELGLVERVMFVRSLATYGRARVEALAELAREMSVVRATKGTELYAIGDPAPYSLLLYSGVVACEAKNGQRFRLGADSVVGGMDSMAGERRWYRAEAETDVIALRSDTSHLMDVIEDNPDMGIDMLRSAARILAELYERVDRANESRPPPPE
ncbi:MAG TPA: cyclic nucleotide-binding domain-containing protein [Polyangiaceae bacterium]|nr:cyclic nucleotide-binding domain-containing protein [Polyangiaceae bacterium]